MLPIPFIPFFHPFLHLSALHDFQLSILCSISTFKDVRRRVIRHNSAWLRACNAGCQGLGPRYIEVLIFPCLQPSLQAQAAASVFLCYYLCESSSSQVTKGHRSSVFLCSCLLVFLSSCLLVFLINDFYIDIKLDERALKDLNPAFFLFFKVVHNAVRRKKHFINSNNFC